MKYDVSMHLPTQLDGMLVAFQKADIATLERSLDNIKNLIKDDKFLKDLDDYEKQKLKKVNTLSVKALEAAKTIAGAKTFSELYVDVDEIRTDLISNLEFIEKDYWNHIKDYITLYINGEDKVDDDDGIGD